MATDGFPCGGQGLLALPDVALPVGEVVEGHGQVRQEGVAVALRQLAIDGYGFPGGGQGLLALPDVALHVGEVVEGHGQIRQEGVAVGLDIVDLEFGRDGLVATVRRSKTDQEGQGRRVGIPYGSHPETCPVRAAQDWVDVLDTSAGPFLRRIDRHGRIGATRLSDKAVALIVKRCAGAAGLDAGDLAGHSLRSGLATAAAAAGVSERAIMAQTGHAASPRCANTSGRVRCFSKMRRPRWAYKSRETKESWLLIPVSRPRAVIRARLIQGQKREISPDAAQRGNSRGIPATATLISGYFSAAPPLLQRSPLRTRTTESRSENSSTAVGNIMSCQEYRSV